MSTSEVVGWFEFSWPSSILKIQYVLSGCSHPRGGVLVPDHRDPAAKRQGCGPGGSVRRHGLADGVRAARLGHASFESHHDLGGGVHVHVAGAVHSGDAECRRERDDSGTEDAGETVCACGSETILRPGTHNSHAIGAWVGCSWQTTAHTAGPTEKVVCTKCGGGGIGRRTSLRC